MLKVRLVQLGCGYWGPNLLRAFSRLEGCEIVSVVEFSEKRRKYIQKEFSKQSTSEDYQPFLLDNTIDGVVIATPAQTHFSLVKEWLQNKKHVFVEKPLAMNLSEAEELVGLAEKHQKILMVGHTFLYHPAVRKLKDIAENELGDVLYFYAQRLNLGKVRSDINVWWNLAPHDLSVFLYLMNDKMPETISVQGVNFLQENIEDVAFATLKWADGKVGHIHASWLDPNKVRKMSVIGRKKMAVYDDMQPEKLTIYDKGVDYIDSKDLPKVFDSSHPINWNYRVGDIYIPHVEMKEPLRIEAEHFLECIRKGLKPITGPKHGMNVVAILDAGQRSLQSNGKTVAVEGVACCLN